MNTKSYIFFEYIKINMREKGHFTDGFEEMGRSLKRTLVSMVIGGVAGAVAGVFIGEKVNDYFEILKQAPTAIQYGIDGVFALSCGTMGGAVVGAASHMYSLYKYTC